MEEPQAPQVSAFSQAFGHSSLLGMDQRRKMSGILSPEPAIGVKLPRCGRMPGQVTKRPLAVREDQVSSLQISSHVILDRIQSRKVPFGNKGDSGAGPSHSSGPADSVDVLL